MAQQLSTLQSPATNRLDRESRPMSRLSGHAGPTLMEVLTQLRDALAILTVSLAIAVLAVFVVGLAFQLLRASAQAPVSMSTGHSPEILPLTSTSGSRALSNEPWRFMACYPTPLERLTLRPSFDHPAPLTESLRLYLCKPVS
jgi:hypothetical protein